jgi:hypothetical protein
MASSFIFHRPDVAEELASALLGDNPLFQAGRSGLFLAGPRRTGKSTFLRNDLIPALEARGALAVYVDLWSDKTRNPADLIAEAVREKLAAVASPAAKSAAFLAKVKKAGVKAKVTGFEAELGFEIDSVGKSSGTTLAKAFEGIHKASGKQIVFIVDEAQHALSTSEGSSALFALKAARDALNLTSDRPGLAILATGSVRGKVADLVSRKSQAFYGATVSDFPPLGKEFVRFLIDTMLSRRLPKAGLPDLDRVTAAFDLLGRRPEELGKAIQASVSRPERDLGDAVVAAAKEIHAQIVADLRHQFERLPPLHRSILRLMAEQTEDFAPFSKASVERYREDTGNPNLVWTAAQKALDALIKEGLVWRSAHGAYSLDDEVLADYLFDKEGTLLLADRQSSRNRQTTAVPAKKTGRRSR